jgi:5'-methylthioinosine phosphorylase
MVGVPEVVLAREQEICYASVCMVTNYACGIREESLTVSEVMETVKENNANIKKIITKTIGTIKEERNCKCKNALEGARV